MNSMETPSNSNGPQDQKPEFFKVLLPGFDQRLLIPPAFTKHLACKVSHAATVQSPTGKSWSVEVCQDEGSLYFDKGWPEISQAHNLNVGFLVLFSYQMDGVFSMKVFDPSGCLKQYPSITQNKERTNSDKRFHYQFSRRKRQVAKAETEMETENTTKPIDTSSQASETMHQHGFCKEKPNQLVKRMTYSSTCYHFLNLPLKFCRINGLLGKGVAIILDPSGRPWQVSYALSRQCGYLGKGWRKFVEANDLKEGDRCILLVESSRESKEKVISVKIIRG